MWKKNLALTAEKKHCFLKDKSPYFLNIRHFWQTFSKVITSLCFMTPLNKSRSSPGYTLVLCIPCWLQGIRFFLMNSSISNSLKWLFYLMHFPYSSWSKPGDEGRWPPVDGRPVAHIKCSKRVPACVPRRDSWAPVDCRSFSTGAESSSFTRFDCWRTGDVIGLAHALSRH